MVMRRRGGGHSLWKNVVQQANSHGEREVQRPLKKHYTLSTSIIIIFRRLVAIGGQ